jgi:uncharacterized protein (TIGR00369 family)
LSHPLDIRAMDRTAFQQLLDELDLHRFVGLAVDSWSADEITFAFAPSAAVRDPRPGGVHGGAIATAIDTAAGFAVTLACGYDIATVDLRVDYIRPAIDAEFRVVGKAVRAGSRFGWGDATVSTLDGRAVAIGRGVFTW